MLRKRAREEAKKAKFFFNYALSVSLANFEIIEQELFKSTGLPRIRNDFRMYSTIAENFNFNNQLPIYTAQHLRRAEASIIPQWQPAIYLPPYWKPVYSIQVYFLQYHN
jgi:hypothetical protein